MNRPIALSHASGPVAEALLEKLSESGFTPDSLVLLDDEMQAGRRIAFGAAHLPVTDQRQADLSQYPLLLLLQDDPQLAQMAQQQGCLVVSHAIDDDDSALFVVADGAEPALSYSASQVRLVGPEAACLLPALTALDRFRRLASVQLTLLRSAAFYGSAGVEELASQTVSLLNARSIEARVYPQQIAFNLLTRDADARVASDIAGFLANRCCPVTLQAVDVPVFHGLAVALQLTFESNVEPEEAKRVLSGLDAVELTSAETASLFDCNQSFGCAISHLHQASDTPSNLQFWLSADPLRYGLANNYVNVVDFLLKSFL